MQKEEGKPIYLNYALLSATWSIIFTAGIYLLFGGASTLFFVLQAVMSIFFLETINYIEHYGLLRKQLEDGSY